MKCGKCGFENPEHVKFCGECGARLEAVCPKCGFSNAPQFKFCGECGQRLSATPGVSPLDPSRPASYTPKHLAEQILTSRSALEGERKIVTVLFADVASYTSISEKLDPEEVHQVMDGCFKILMDEIHHYEGTINQFTGDGVMALFGAPLAHEDHAQRACHAALAIQKAMEDYGEKIQKQYRLPFQLRIGLNSGPVVVGKIGDDLRMDYTALGDTTNLAARIQQAARPGEVWISQETRNIVKDYFREELAGEIPLKGKREPQTIYRVVSERPEVRTRFEAGLAGGMTQLVGRRWEMEALHAIFQRVRAGEPHVVDVVGEAGVGKSRLIYEFQRAIDGDAHFLTGVCVPHGEKINFLPVADVVKGAFGIAKGMSEEEVGQHIVEGARGALGPMVPFYWNLLSLKVDDPKFNALNPEGRKFGTFEAVKNLLFALSAKNALIISLDDVHWIDRISEEFFSYFSRSFVDRPIMMLTAYRPGDSPPWAQSSHYQRLGLEELNARSCVELVRNLLGGMELEPELGQTIIEKTGGNPFFLEEIVRELLERGDLAKDDDRVKCTLPLEHCKIPTTVQGVLAARIDRLTDDLKRTLQVASVIGKDFPHRLLGAVMELGDELRTHLANLVALDFLSERTLYPEPEYSFRQALAQEVAYESLLKPRRQGIHGRVARAIEALYADRLEQHYELLAHHWELSDIPERSISYLVLAGEKSNQCMAASAAVDFFTRALGQIERTGKRPDPGLVLRIRAGRASPLHTTGKIEESFGDYQEAIRLAKEMGDDQTALNCLMAIPTLIYNTRLNSQVPQFCEEGLGLARALGDKGAEAGSIANLAFWRHVWHGHDDFEALYRALALAQESGQPRAIFVVRLMLALFERSRGDPRRSSEYSEGLIEMLQSAFNVFAASSLSFVRGWALTEAGRYEEAIRFLSHWKEIMERNAIYINLGRCCNSLGWAYAEVYDLQRALRCNQQASDAIAMLQRSPSHFLQALEMQAMTEVNLMENAFDMGKVDEAWQHLTSFEQESAHPDYDLRRDRWTLRMMDLKGRILLRRRDLEEANQVAQGCLEVATERKYKKFMGKAERLLGQVATEKGAYDLAEMKLGTALAKFEEVGNPKQLWTTCSALARLYQRMGGAEEERNQWQAAAAIVRSTADGLKDEELRNSFLDAAPIREIMEKASS